MLVVAHGTVEDLEEIPQFLREIRHGRAAPPELVEEMRRRYAAIGGSPLLEQTRKQARALGAETGLPTRVAMRFSEPRVESVTKDLGAEEGICLVPMAPLSVHVYEQAARRALSARPDGPKLIAIEPWALAPALVATWVEAIEVAALEVPEPRLVVLTAHSLPVSVIAAGDPYQTGFEAMARAVTTALGSRGVLRAEDVVLAYQSAGQAGGEWLGPTLGERLQEAARTAKRGLVVAPLGFVAEHVETLYDLDIEARHAAERSGLAFVRVPVPASAEGVIQTLGRAVRQAIASHRDELPGPT